MLKQIISEGTLVVSTLPSHQGCSSEEITKDCIEKVQAMLSRWLSTDSDDIDVHLFQQLSLMDDLLCMASQACDRVNR